MRRSGRRRETLEVSLFPFLAVLICTFGVLFILLVLAVKVADQSAQQANQADLEQIEKRVDELNGQLDLELVRSEGLSEVRPELVERLQNVRHIRSHLENEIRRMNEEAAILARQLERQDEEPGNRQLEAIDQQLKEWESRLAAAVTELEQKQQLVSNRQPVMYSIVPYDGSGGEMRIPIYIECRGKRMIIQPHNITIDLPDFAIPVSEKNPLDAALMAVREYYLRHDLNGSQGSPYPLLVVRPDGADSYSLARHAIRGWDDEFGYELVSEKKRLVYGESDPQLTEEIRQAVAESIREQRELMEYRRALAANERRRESMAVKPGLRASRRHGGFVNQSEGMESGQGLGQAGRQAGRQVAHRGTPQAEGNEPMFATGNDQEGPEQAGGPDQTGSQTGGRGSGVSLAQQRGKNWALPSMTAGAVGYRRPIRVYFSREEITFETKSQSSRRVRIKVGTNMVLAVDTMVDEIWRMIDSWGVTGANGYWVPELRFTVAPGAESQMEQLLELLQGSGLDIEGAGQ
ncbi:MAG: hypothetical protein MK108_00930 [Mariniblastus sp.]|nr:hypothetical protein [Mariniblastus sp.]